MRSVVTFIFSPRQSLELVVELDADGEASEAAREWFDMIWTRLGCEPVRASGKVLLLDKILGVTNALGYEELSGNAGKAHELAIKPAQALDRPRVTVDIPGLHVGF
jgi:hypothetical protein